MLQNARVAAFTISELLRKNQQGGGVKLPPFPTQIRVNGDCVSNFATKLKKCRVEVNFEWLSRTTSNFVSIEKVKTTFAGMRLILRIEIISIIILYY